MDRRWILVALAALVWSGCEASQGQGPMEIREFVHQVYFEGVPYEDANKYDASVVPALLEMLEDPAEEEYWANIVVTLGIIGDESAVDPMTAFIARGEEGTMSRVQYTAKTSAIMSMGYLINKTGNEKALDYLEECLNPQYWSSRGPAGASPYGASVEERNRDLSKYAVLGLALSGHPSAAELLRSTQEPSTAESLQAFRTEVSDVVVEALSTHEKIAEVGLEEYYRTSKP